MSSSNAVPDALTPRPIALALAGSPSPQSRSSTLLAYAVSRARALGFDVEEIGLRDLPAEDLIGGNYVGDAARTLRERIGRASALLVSTPVYKASFSGGLKTVLDLLAERSLTGKVVLPLATGGSPAHLLALEYSLKPVLSALGARHILAGIYATESQVSPQKPVSEALDPLIAERLDAAVDRLGELVRPAAPPAPAFDLGRLASEARLGI